MVNVFFSSILFFCLIFIVICDHFFGGTISWRPLNASDTGTPVAIVITQTYTWAYSQIPCTYPMIAYNQLVPNFSEYSITELICISNCGSGSVGYSNVSITPQCTDGSSAFNISVGQRSDIVYLQSGDNFTVAYQDGSWLNLVTSSNANWSLTSQIDVTLRPDNGLYNNAPFSTMISPVNIIESTQTAIHVPVYDADGDDIRCRWANLSYGINECGDVCPVASLPPSTDLYPNCTVVITGPNTGDWYALAIMVEDFSDPSSLTPLSSIPVQFLVHVVAPSTCTFSISGEPQSGFCDTAAVGEMFVFRFGSSIDCGFGVDIVDILTISFLGAIQSNLTLSSGSYYKDVSWTPTITQVGPQMICGMAINNQEDQSNQYCFNFNVSLISSCPTTTITTDTTFTSTDESTTTSTTDTTETETTTTSESTTSITTTTDNTTETSAVSVTDSTSSSETEQYNLSKWLIIGFMIGVPALLAIIMGSCFCWYYCCPCGIGRLKLADSKGPFEFYHIKSNTESNNRPFDVTTLNFTPDPKPSENPPISNTSGDNINKSFLKNNVDDEYTPSTSKAKSPLKLKRNSFMKEHSILRRKPNRVSPTSPSSATSSSRLILSEQRIKNDNINSSLID